MATQDKEQQDDTDNKTEQQTLSGDTASIADLKSTTSQGGKVTEVIEKYGMHGIGKKLERRYDTQQDRWSLRDLEQFFNRKVLDHATRGKDVAEDDYHDCLNRLKSDKRELTVERLNRAGVDGSEVISDMMSYETIRHYLMNYRGVTAEQNYITPPESAEAIGRLQSRLESILEHNLQAHYSRGEIPQNPEIRSSVEVVCPECGATVSAVKYLKLRTCPNCI